MNDRLLRTFVSYQRIVLNLGRSAPSLAPEARVVFERLKATVDEITFYYNQQYSVQNRHYVLPARRQLDKMRNDQMLPLARLARRVFAGESAILAALRVPHKRAQTEAILAASVGMVKALRPHRALLAESHIDPTRLDRLLRETRRLKKVFPLAYAARADRAMPTRRLPELFASARMDVLVLDALQAADPNWPSALTWKSTRRVGKRIGRPPAKRRARRDTPQ